MMISEFDHLQQAVDIFKAMHDVLRNEKMFVKTGRGDEDLLVKDPNDFTVENTTQKDKLPEQSIFEVDEGHFTKLIAQRVG